MIYRILGALLRAIISKNIKFGNECLSFTEFVYNKTIHSTTHCSLFDVVYEFNPLVPLDLFLIPSNISVSEAYFCE